MLAPRAPEQWSRRPRLARVGSHLRGGRQREQRRPDVFGGWDRPLVHLAAFHMWDTQSRRCGRRRTDGIESAQTKDEMQLAHVDATSATAEPTAELPSMGLRFFKL